jgi:hypothetical protein
MNKRQYKRNSAIRNITPPLLVLKALDGLYTAFIRREFFGISVFGTEFKPGLATLSGEEIAGMMMCYWLNSKNAVFSTH